MVGLISPARGSFFGGAFAFFCSLLCSGNTLANAAEVYGLGSDGISRAGAMTAAATGHESVFYNPAGVAFHQKQELSLGYLSDIPDLSISTGNGKATRDLTDPDLLLIGFTLPLGERLGVGFSAYLPVNPLTVTLVDARSPEDPHFSYFNRTQRLVIFSTAAVRPLKWLSLGLGLNILSGLQGTASSREGPTHQLQPLVSQELVPRLAFNAGVRVEPLPRLALGATYRQAFSVPFTVNSSHNVVGIPLEVLLQAEALQTPHELALGAALRPVEALQLSLDTTWLFWSMENAPFIKLSADLGGGRITQQPPRQLYRDTFNIRLGAVLEQKASDSIRVAYRLGHFFEPSYLEDQPGRSNLLDGTKLGFCGGMGVTLQSEIYPQPITFDVHFQAISVLSRTYQKVISSVEEARIDPNALADEDGAVDGDQISNPGYPSISGSGMVYTVGATLTVEIEPVWKVLQ